MSQHRADEGIHPENVSEHHHHPQARRRTLVLADEELTFSSHRFVLCFKE